MNIMMVLFFFPPISGGGSVVAADMANGMARLGHDVTVVMPDLAWDGPPYRPPIHASVRTIRVHVLFNDKIKIAARLCRIALAKKGIELGGRKKFDMIFTIFHPFHMALNAAVSIGGRLGLPVIVKVDDAVRAESPRMIKRLQWGAERILNARALKRAAKILAVNAETQDVICSTYGVLPEAVSVMPNGVDTDLFADGSGHRQRMVVFSGAMYVHRGVDALIRAAPKVVSEVPDTRFVLLGDGPEMGRLQGLARESGVDGNIEFKGWVSRDEVIEYLGRASVGIGPLRSTQVTKNALPIKVLEYMAASLPVVCWRGTLSKDVLEDGRNGYLIGGGDELAARIIQMLKNGEERCRLARRSRQIAANFDWGVLIRGALELG